MGKNNIPSVAVPNPECRPALLEIASQLTGIERHSVSMVATAMLCNDYCFRSDIERVKRLLPALAPSLELPKRDIVVSSSDHTIVSETTNPVFRLDR